MTNSSLMKDESITECSPWSILQYFWPALSNNWCWNPLYGHFESGCFRQVLLYLIYWRNFFFISFLFFVNIFTNFYYCDDNFLNFDCRTFPQNTLIQPFTLLTSPESLPIMKVSLVTGRTTVGIIVSNLLVSLPGSSSIYQNKTRSS